MSKNENAKKTTWEKLTSEAGQETTENESAIKGETMTQKEKSSPNKLTPLSYELLETKLSETETQLEEHKSELAEYKKEYTYQLAEMENIRRRSQLELENAYKFSLKKIIEELLPIKDSLEAALASRVETENDNSLKGIELTLNQLQSTLEKNGVAVIEPSPGESFDAHYHQAMITKESTEQTPNTILKVLQKGYTLNGRLLRPALIVVAKAIEEPL